MKPLRAFFKRRLRGCDYEDRLHDTLLDVIQVIRRGELRDPESAMRFLRVVAHRKLILGIKSNQRARNLDSDDALLQLADPRPDAEAEALMLERERIMRDALEELDAQHREILVRYYLEDQDKETICRDMGLTGTQYRLRKSRAKNQVTLIVAARARARAFQALVERGRRAHLDPI